MPRVSVIIPLFNKAPHIARCVDSILTQTFTDYEVIVVDDGSTDDGPQRVTAYHDPRIALVSQPNAGPAAARNRGIGRAAGELVAFLDADDEWEPAHLIEAVQRLDDHPQSALTASGHFRDEPDVDEQYWISRGIATGLFVLPVDYDADRIKHTLDFTHTSSVVMRRDVAQRYGGFYDRTRCTYGEDSWLWLLVMLNHPVVFDTTPHSWYHTQESELGVGRAEVPPARPIVTDPEPLREVCPDEYKPLLERIRGLIALQDARRFANQGDSATARRILQLAPEWERLETPMAIEFQRDLGEALAWGPLKILRRAWRRVASGAAGN